MYYFPKYLLFFDLPLFRSYPDLNPINMNGSICVRVHITTSRICKTHSWRATLALSTCTYLYMFEPWNV
jgi:hypothetical protein